MKARIISFHCVLRNKVGIIISSTFNHDVITHGDIRGDEKPGQLLKGLADSLQGLKKGDKKEVCLSAEQAYGFYDPKLVLEVPRSGFTEGSSLQVGQQVLTQSDEGETKTFRVVQATSNSVTLDGNHPLAGQDLIFEIDTIDTREATSEEIAESCFSHSNHYFH